MSGYSHKQGPTMPPLWQERGSQPVCGVFAQICQLETLRHAYDELRQAPQRYGISATALNGIDGEGAEEFVRQLSQQLAAGTVSPATQASDDRAAIATRVVEVAFHHVLMEAFPGPSRCRAEPDDVVKWLAAIIKRGLSRACALSLDERGTRDPQRLVELAARQIGDAKAVELLRSMPADRARLECSEPSAVGPMLLNVALQGIDRVLQQGKTLGRQGGVDHAAAGRFGVDLLFLVDNCPEFDWLIPAVRKRIAEEAAEINVEIDPGKTQILDLARGDKLHFAGQEFRAVKTRDGMLRVEHEPVVLEQAPEHDGAPGPEEWHLPGYLAACAIARWLWRQPRWVYALLGCLLLAATGLSMWSLFRADGPRLYAVRGQVFLEGKPPTGALVVFHPSERVKQGKHRPTGRVAEDGSYVLGTYKEGDGAPPGEYTVTVNMLISKTENLSPVAKKKKVANFPAKYGAWETTPLLATVRPEPTEVPAFELEKEKETKKGKQAGKKAIAEAQKTQRKNTD